MPVALVLRVEGVAWRLRAQDLPQTLPDNLKVQRGVFVLRPHPEYLRRHVERDRFIYVRRIEFPVAPADARIVYAAQGETFEAVVADMQRPPRMEVGIHWLACYVMLSRAKTVDGFLVLRPAS